MRQSVDLDLPKAKKDRSAEFAWLYVFVTGATGLAVFAVSSALGAVGWAFADLPAVWTTASSARRRWHCSESCSSACRSRAGRPSVAGLWRTQRGRSTGRRRLC